MEIAVFIDNYKEAFGDRVSLPVAFWYSDLPAGECRQVNGCFFKVLPSLRDGEVITLGEENTTCGGGKFYCGFTPMPEHVPQFVSSKERYKQTPEDVLDYLDRLQVPRSGKPFLNFARIDRLKTFEGLEGILFLATPDVLSGLLTWAFFDNNDPGAVSTIFGSGCCTVVTLAVSENKKQGRRTFLGGFDPSVRPYFKENELSFTVPFSRFREMYGLMRQSCLYDTHAWKKVKERITAAEHPGL